MPLSQSSAISPHRHLFDCCRRLLVIASVVVSPRDFFLLKIIRKINRFNISTVVFLTIKWSIIQSDPSTMIEIFIFGMSGQKVFKIKS